MIIFINPADQQIMAVYSHDTESTVWEDRGFTRQEVADPSMVATILQHRRDAFVDIVEREVVQVTERLNTIQPAPPVRTRLDDLHDELDAGTITHAGLREMLLLERSRGQ